MPPLRQYTKTIILNAAFEQLRKDGMESLSARSIAKQLGSSTQPVYSAYKTMDDLKHDIRNKAREFNLNFLMQEGSTNDAFLNIGMQYLRFMQYERQLFKLLYLDGSDSPDFVSAPFPDKLIEQMRKQNYLSQLNNESLSRLLSNMQIYTHGLATMIFSGLMPYDENHVCELLSKMGEILVTHEISETCKLTNRNHFNK
ncbi:MAG: TetR family transcriptional regulator [Spirochaetes bacterium]|nr:TetR family transcriptional regulator [Spirochaetota bacterium]MBN2772231.1 TetR family transcriptional regulator [Spirochaetota bacterium]